jgi:hypothetical protein
LVTLAWVAVIGVELNRSYDPTPVLPIPSTYCVTPVPAVHWKVTLLDVSAVPGVGEVSTAGVAAAVYV